VELLFTLLAIQTLTAFAGGVWLWRRQQRQGAEIAALREALGAAQKAAAAAQSAEARPRRAAATNAAVIPVATDIATTSGETAAPLERARRAWFPAAPAKPAQPTSRISADTARGLTLGVLALAPALAFAFGGDAAIVVASGLAIGAAMMVIGQRPDWRAAAWAGVVTAGVWALIGFAIQSAHADPVSYAVCLSLAAATGLAHAYRHKVTPGVTMAAIMAIAALALGAQTSMVGAAGASFGFIVAAAAIAGALTLRLEGVHFAAFAASLIGLFVLSGQESAAIWFTPATAWAGAVFFGIAAVRVPQLGARGVAIAGTGVLGPLAAITALYFAQHGLADPIAAAGGFAVLAALIVGVIAAAAIRRERGIEALKATLWVLALGAFIAFATAAAMALPAALAAPLFALAALALARVDLALPARAWRTLAALSSLATLIFAIAASQVLLRESSDWPGLAIAVSGVAAPAAIIGAAAIAARPRGAKVSAGLLEALAIILAVIAASLFLRLIYSGGAVLFQPISFAEAGAHVAAWLGAALLIRERARYGIRPVRIAAANALLVVALGAMFAAALLWATPYWQGRAADVPLISHHTLGFLLPALLFLAHVPTWRRRGAATQTRLTFAAGVLLLAAFITAEVTRMDGGADWAGAVTGALAFAAAIGANFIPGVVRLRDRFPSQ
jgi:hypothetical protein